MRDLLPVIKETTGSRSADEVVLLEKKFTKISENPIDKSPLLWYNIIVKRGEPPSKEARCVDEPWKPKDSVMRVG